MLDDLTLFLGSALKVGSAAIVAATESHRASLLPRLHTYGLDMDKAIQESRYIALDAADGLSKFMVNEDPSAESDDTQTRRNWPVPSTLKILASVTGSAGTRLQQTSTRSKHRCCLVRAGEQET